MLDKLLDVHFAIKSRSVHIKVSDILLDIFSILVVRENFPFYNSPIFISFNLTQCSIYIITAFTSSILAIKLNESSCCWSCENLGRREKIWTHAQIVSAIAAVVFFVQIGSIFYLSYVPWGKASITSDGNFECQHGPMECTINTVEACVLHYYPERWLQHYMHWLVCMLLLL